MDKKLIVLISLFTIVVVVVGIIIVGSGGSRATLEKTAGAKIAIDHDSRSVGDIPYEGGLLIHSFPIKNTGNQNLEIGNIATSCMCTQAYLKKGDTESDLFGMKGMSGTSSWKGILKPGESAEIIAKFDPKFHGPQGTGPVSRSVSFETNDLDKPYVEVAFDGVVVK